MQPISVQTPDKLREELQRIDISVPPRTERDSEDCERWSICRFLASYADSELLEYPLELIHRDRPDFHLSMAEHTVGIEVTEVVPQNQAAIDAYRKNKGLNDDRYMKHHSADDPKLDRRQIAREATANEMGPGWAGDSCEVGWAKDMDMRIRKKAGVLTKDGFDRFDSDWLLIYDNWPVPALDDLKGISNLANLLSNESTGFKLVIIETSARIWAIDGRSYCSYPINDLWQGG